MSKILIHEHTKTMLDQFSKEPSHALLLTGPNGIGKTYLAHTLAEQLLGLDVEGFSKHPYARLVSPDEKNTISIDMIRDLQHFLQLKTIGTQSVRRIAIIEHGERLRTEAQNAFLKLLEEPPEDTVLIVTTTTPQALLPTILSRVQVIPVNAPDIDSIKKHFAAAGEATAAIDRTYALSEGLPGLMRALLSDDQGHPLVEGVNAAKELLTLPMAERLSRIDKLSKQKEAAGYMIEALLHIARAGVTQASKIGDDTRLLRWHRVLKTAFEAQEALRVNANTKLVLTNVALHM
jgi:DNA polymerase III subunit delta'